jgi:hypothetical protein
LAGFDSTDPNDHGVVSTNVIITNNTLLSTNALSFTDSFQGTPTKFTDGVAISGNIVKGDIFVLYSKKFVCSNNQGTGSVEPWQGDSTGFVTDNLMPLRFNGSGYIKRAGNGGNIAVFNNISPTTFKPNSPLVQGGYVGVSNGIPTAGTWETGHWVQNGNIALSASNSAQPFGFICIAGGSPGTWVPIGQPLNQYSRDFFFAQTGNNQTRTVFTFTMPHGSTSAIQVTFEGMITRSPNGNMGTSKTFKKVFFAARNNTDTDTVIDVLTSVGEYEVTTTTTGGSNNPASPNITMAIASGGTTDSQVITVTMFYSLLSFISTKISVNSTRPLSTFGL